MGNKGKEKPRPQGTRKPEWKKPKRTNFKSTGAFCDAMIAFFQTRKAYWEKHGDPASIKVRAKAGRVAALQAKIASLMSDDEIKKLVEDPEFMRVARAKAQERLDAAGK